MNEFWADATAVFICIKSKHRVTNTADEGTYEKPQSHNSVEKKIDVITFKIHNWILVKHSASVCIY